MVDEFDAEAYHDRPYLRAALRVGVVQIREAGDDETELRDDDGPECDDGNSSLWISDVGG